MKQFSFLLKSFMYFFQCLLALVHKCGQSGRLRLSEGELIIYRPEPLVLPPDAIPVFRSLDILLNKHSILTGRISRDYIKLPSYLSLHVVDFQPITDIDQLSESCFKSTGIDPAFLLMSDQGRLPGGPVVVEFFWESAAPCSPKLYFDDGYGYGPEKYVNLFGVTSGLSRTLVTLPSIVSSLRFDPLESETTFSISNFRIIELRFAPGNWRCNLLNHLVQIDASYNFYLDALHQDKIVGHLYKKWLDDETLTAENENSEVLRSLDDLRSKPIISIIMPVYDPDPEWLRRAIDSVLCQSYTNWELCIADDNSSNPSIHKTIERYRIQDPRIKTVYRKKRGHICAASNSALSLAEGDFCAFFDHDDILHRHALYYMAVELDNYPGSKILYSDEDKIHCGPFLSDDHHQPSNAEYRFAPYFKPDWNPELLLQQNYVSHLSVYSMSLIRELGGFRDRSEGAQDWDLLLRASELVDEGQIRHIPRILYHWRVSQGSTALSLNNKPYAYAAGMRVIEDALQRRKISANVIKHPEDDGSYRIHFNCSSTPEVAIVIPSKDNSELLASCLSSILSRRHPVIFRIYIVDNGSTLPRTLSFLQSLSDQKNISVLYCPGDFNFSKMVNLAIEKSTDEFILLLNDDTEATNSDWLRELVSIAQLPKTGVVGARLLYKDGRIQHAGVVLGVGGIANHAFQGTHFRSGGINNRSRLFQRYSAVTGACMCFRRPVWMEVGGFNEELPTVFNDVDFCLRVQAAGYSVLWTPHSTLYHHESASLGDLTQREDSNFRNAERFMKSKWKRELEHDPAYNVNLNNQRADFKPGVGKGC